MSTHGSVHLYIIRQTSHYLCSLHDLTIRNSPQRISLCLVSSVSGGLVSVVDRGISCRGLLQCKVLLPFVPQMMEHFILICVCLHNIQLFLCITLVSKISSNVSIEQISCNFQKGSNMLEGSQRHPSILFVFESQKGFLPPSNVILGNNRHQSFYSRGHQPDPHRFFCHFTEKSIKSQRICKSGL